MELSLPNTLLAGDPRLVDHIVGEVKSQGIFDQFRKECIADVDTKVCNIYLIFLNNFNKIIHIIILNNVIE